MDAINTEFVNLFLMLVKWGMVITLGVYLMFAYVIVRQIELMVRSFETPKEELLRKISWVHLGFVLLLMVVVIVIL